MTVERAVPGEAEWAQLSAPHMARYLTAAEFVSGGRVLDAGSGAGYGSALLKLAGASEVHGVDLDPAAVDQARDQFGDAPVQFLVDDCEHLQQVSGSFDVICCFELIEHLARPETFLRRAGQLLADGGVLLISTPDRAATPPFVNGRPRNRFHVYEWHRTEFEQMLNAHFSQVELRVQVESVALHTRQEAVAALRQGLMWSNPVLMFVWRKWGGASKANRAWKKLAGLSAPTVGDYPVVPRVAAAAYGTPCYHFAVCRKPKKRAETGELP